MKTSIKEQYSGTCSYYRLDMLENESEITALIQCEDGALLPCPCCGQPSIIGYSYCTETPLHPHHLQGKCSDIACGIQTKEWYAEDNEADFMETVRLICTAWNRRPEKKDD